MKDLQPEIDKILSAWIRRLEEEWIWKPEQPTDFDIGKRIQFLTVDIITQLCLGDSFQCSENDRDQYGFLETVKSATPISLQMSTFPEFTKIMYHLTKNSTIRRLLVPSIRDKGGIGTVIKVGHVNLSNQPIELCAMTYYGQVIKQKSGRSSELTTSFLGPGPPSVSAQGSRGWN